MITNKQLRELGFTFTRRWTAYLHLKDCSAYVIGGILSFTAKPKREPARFFELEGLNIETIRRNIRIYNIGYTPVIFDEMSVNYDADRRLFNVKMAFAPMRIVTPNDFIVFTVVTI